MPIDLRSHFKHLHWRPMPHSFGVPVASDWADKSDDDPVFGLYKQCGLWTMDEVQILAECSQQVGGEWLDIGAHTGWTTAHCAVGARGVFAIDPLLRLPAFRERFRANTEHCRSQIWSASMETSRDFLSAGNLARWSGVVIDGDHQPGEPLHDAQQAAAHLTPTGVILLHDFVGAPVREAVTWLLDHGFQARVYLTVHMVAVCWRGDFRPPEHAPDPRVLAADLPARCPEFDWGRLA